MVGHYTTTTHEGGVSPDFLVPGLPVSEPTGKQGREVMKNGVY